MAKTTKAELAARVTELEEKLAEITSERDALGRDFESVCWELRDAETKIARLEGEIAGRGHSDALVAFVAALPRKVVYRALARALHPDMGGETAAMQALTQAWSATRARSQS